MWMYCESMPSVFPATSVVHVGFRRARCSTLMIWFSESTMARSRWTATLSFRSCGPYSTSATSAGSAGRASTHSRPSPTCGSTIRWGPSATGLAASVVSGLPMGAGAGGSVSRTAALGTGRPRPPLGPGPRLVPPNGGSSTGRGALGGTIVMRTCSRSMRQDVVTATAMSMACSTALAAQVSRLLSSGTFTGSNSGQDPPESLRRLDQPRRGDGERDAEEPLAPCAEPAAGERHHARLLEGAARERCRRDALGQRHPDVHRRLGRLGLEPLRPQHRQHRVAPLLEPGDVVAGERLRLRQHGGAGRLDREERARVHVVLHARERRDYLGASHRPAEPPPGH